MHRAALAELGLSAEWTYDAIEVAPAEFDVRVRALAGEGFAGVNVTVPHKVAALAVADDASEAARAIGAANTLSFAEGRIAADNTDASGLIEALPRPPRGMSALVMGAGGSARAAVWALAEHGAEVTVWNRTHERAVALAAELGAAAAPGEGDPLSPGSFDLIVNATTVGMGGSEGEAAPGLKALPIEADALSTRHVVVDLAYGTADTELVSAAKARGADVVDGLEVLVRQGAASLRIWTGMEPPIETMRRAARA
jgi:shikimate dehydrogenase